MKVHKGSGDLEGNAEPFVHILDLLFLGLEARFRGLDGHAQAAGQTHAQAAGEGRLLATPGIRSAPRPQTVVQRFGEAIEHQEESARTLPESGSAVGRDPPQLDDVGVLQGGEELCLEGQITVMCDKQQS